MSYSGMQYHDSCPPPPGVDCDRGYPGPRERDMQQRERDRVRRHEHRFREYSGHDERYGGYNERDAAYEDRDYRCEDPYGRRPRYSDRRNSGHPTEGDRDDRRGYRDHGRYRDHDRDRMRDGREREGDRGRERDRDHSRDRERNWDRERPGNREDWREEIPNNTIMVRNLGPEVTENDIRNEIVRCGLKPKDVRLMRKKDSGDSRGFAFVEFQLLSEAVRWKELTQGLVFFDGQSRSTLHYSIPKDSAGPERGYSSKADWSCSKCGVNNFRRRELCFKCNSPRDDPDISSIPADGGDEVSTYPSNTLLFRNLDVLTTEERVLSMLGQLTMLPIKSLRVAKDSVTNTSRGFAFVELHSTSEATQLHDLLVTMDGKFFVDGRQVTVSYARRSLTSMNGSVSANAASVALAAAQWTNQDTNDQGYSGESSASAAPIAPSHPPATDLGTVVVDGLTYKVYPVPDMSSYRYDQSSGFYYDPSTGLYYDASSRYYYNAEAQQYMYWDGEKQTYLPAPSSVSSSSEGNALAAASGDPSRYQSHTTSAPAVLIAAATVAAAPPKKAEEIAEAKVNEAIRKEGEVSQDKGKDSKAAKQLDKVKIAKKIAKDMEKWAKTLNQKKENAKLGLSMAAPQIDAMYSSPSSADAGFAVLEKKTTAAERNALMAEVLRKTEEHKFCIPSSPSDKPTLVAAYGGESDSDPEADIADEGSNAYDLLKAEELKLTDWSKLACLMCKRQFPTRDALLRHQQLSDLHKQNMEAIKLTKLTPHQVEELERKEREAGYRDRAKERRQKFGQPDEPPPNRLKARYLKEREEKISTTPEQPTKSGIGEDNIGNKMLKAMGWSEGQGLGKSGQGMSGIIEVQQRAKTAGLGMKGSTYGVTAGDSYKEAVKKAMQARFKEISD